MKVRKVALLAVKLAVSSGLLFFLYRTTPVAEVRGLLGAIDFRYFLPICLLLFANTVLSAEKWRRFLSADGVSVPLATLTATYLIGSFYNMFLPSNIGGDSFRIYDMARTTGQGVRSAASVFADRFSGFLALVILSCMASVGVAYKIGDPLFFFGPMAIFILLMFILFALVKKSPITMLLRLTRLDRIGFVGRLVEKFFLSMENYGTNTVLLRQVMLISFAFQFSVICVVFFLALSLHAPAPFIYFVAFVPLITLMEALPISIYGLGVRDMGYVFFFGWAGLSDIQTRSLALLFLAVTVCYSLIGGGVHLWRLVRSAGSRPDHGQPSSNGN
jgi:uncharacterized membrane protein YbhN (UPF0104 family)